ncbi:hypothetical protein SCWH03_10090 [Streptomyces pacificus]|uniref:Uncharacterized protein n=1 Tax=Streptomyces pacificus TaxID=2705029 RepID=A0A6A0AQP1_9ACTN|nr:hypothetical protein SCWH03_10090 [Streptomyces pacificus]
MHEADWDDNGAPDELIGTRRAVRRGDLHALAVAGGAPAVTGPQRALAAFLRLPAG